MIPPEQLAAFVIASIALALVPGPDNIFVLTQSALYGRKAGILVTLGLCTGLIFHTVLVAAGVAALLLASAFAFGLLKLVGVIYLLFLAWQAFHASATKLQTNKACQLTGFQLYRRGIIMNITNPKVSIFFLAFLPQFTAPANGSIGQQIFLLGSIFMLTTLLVFGGVAFAAGGLGSWLQRTPKAQVYMQRLAGFVFVGLAIKLLSVNLNQ
ncbi:MAG: LysE family translocator [Xanthomonadales bacterium]|nr:LysE family translocator [Xanthomonadales bacterium]